MAPGAGAPAGPPPSATPDVAAVGKLDGVTVVDVELPPVGFVELDDAFVDGVAGATVRTNVLVKVRVCLLESA